MQKAKPLVSLDAIAFDTETTGLDTKQARVIQLGAVKLVHGRVDFDSHFQQLVNPGVPIPEQSSKIHGIYDTDIAQADNFTRVIEAFNRWREDAVLIGYASGFDLAVLKREHEIASIEWSAPRTLDVRYLVNIIAPNLPDFSLDTIASWLGVEVHDRHSALGDAIATAEIFSALIPQLREKGIRTLGEAERACKQMSQSTTDEVSLGWHELDQNDHTADSLTALQRIDSYPYRHRLRDLMTSPVLFVDASQSVRDVLNIIIENRSSAVFVRPDSTHTDTGIVTERDLLRTINAAGKDALEQPVHEIAQYPLFSLSADAFIYRAISRMKRYHFRHLGVHDARGNIIGALSARDLLRQRADHALVLGDEIDHAENAEAMAVVWGNIAVVASGLAKEGVEARDIAAVVSRELCALTRQACKISEAQMLEDGLGEAPCAYAILVLGSGGRGESLLAMDQDNAIIYARCDNNEDNWFAELGKRVSDILHIAGVPYCKGNIMASSPDWRQSVKHWKATISTWIKRQTPDDILNCDIFFDSVCVHGNCDLANEVLDYAFEIGAKSTTFIKLMSVNACKNKTPLGLFGRFRLVDGRMDLKIGGIMSIFSCARILAIRHHCRELSTPARLQAVLDKQHRMQSTFENLDQAHAIIFRCILTQQLIDLEKGVPLSNHVAPASLSTSERKQLKWALEQVPNVSNLLGDPLSSL
ncbi:MAG: DUF294 nucleotidyltransferase-like domain-containing protein [Gammaproteobacteria bacterium]|nr:DUF294 nucleotidyltransferase-like domain-containing protein [Gammaproteobacteria bacterium]